MNDLIAAHFDALEAELVASPAVRSFIVVRREISTDDGKTRIKATLTSNELLEFFVYAVAIELVVKIEKYSYHWQDSSGTLKMRWDNAPHYPSLANAPHHRHRADGEVISTSGHPKLTEVLRAIEGQNGS